LESACTATFRREDGEVREHRFTLSVGRFNDQPFLQIGPQLAGASVLGVECRPLTG
jgi:hypothetical protein